LDTQDAEDMMAKKLASREVAEGLLVIFEVLQQPESTGASAPAGYDVAEISLNDQGTWTTTPKFIRPEAAAPSFSDQPTFDEAFDAFVRWYGDSERVEL
jgi:hypothetical protein